MRRRERQTDDNLPTPIDHFDDVVDRLWGRAFRGRPAVDTVFYLASDLGDFSVLWLLIGAAQGLRSETDADAAGRLGLTLAAESLLVNQGIKRLIDRPRPKPVEPRPMALRKPLTSSFPSGHASAATVASTLLSQRDPKLAPAYALLAAIVATSRIHVQIHHASDVIAGVVTGALIGRFVAKTWPVPARG
ncbi:MAG: phosphatase PAP2 family protein [Acidimicrobiales bacterium]